SNIARAGIVSVWAQRLDKRNAAAVKARLKLDRVHRFLTVVAGSTTPLAAGTIILLGATLVMQGELTGGTLVAVTILVWRLFAPIQQGLMVATRVPDLARLLSQIDTMMQIGTGEVSRDARISRNLAPRLEAEGLYLRYPGGTSPALNGVNFKVDAGQFVVITGPSGAGKTTLLRAIAGHYAPQSGTVRLGGTNIQQLDHGSLAEGLAYITEAPLIFHGTLAQNLLLAAPNASPAEMRAVVEELGYLELVNALPDGFETRLDFARSSVLTPGLKAMIAVSQAFLRGPGVILMDEPTANMTDEAEAHLLNAIAARHGQTTILMVSHRRDHIGRADLVLSLSSGRQTGFGPPNRKAV
ncbi:MAG: ATP-binding cassette domain-containing protein, partial [Pseudomonadota bacterium]